MIPIFRGVPDLKAIPAEVSLQVVCSYVYSGFLQMNTCLAISVVTIHQIADNVLFNVLYKCLKNQPLVLKHRSLLYTATNACISVSYMVAMKSFQLIETKGMVFIGISSAVISLIRLLNTYNNNKIISSIID